MKGSQIIFVFVFALCVASQKEDRPPVYPLNSFGSNGQQPFIVPVQPTRSPNISSSIRLPPKYPPPPPPPPRQPQPINPFGKPVQQRGNEGYPTQKDIPFKPRDVSENNYGRPSDIQTSPIYQPDASPSKDFETDLNNIPQISQDENLNDLENSAQFKGSNAQGTQSSIFDPNDYSLNLNTGNNLCNKLRYFAFRTRTNSDATKRYLSVSNVCQSENLFFANVVGQPNSNMLFSGILLQDNTWVFESKTCPGYFIRATPSGIVDSTQGAYGSSKFYVRKSNFNYVVIQSKFYLFNYWRGYGSILFWGPSAFKYMVQYWPL